MHIFLSSFHFGLFCTIELKLYNNMDKEKNKRTKIPLTSLRKSINSVLMKKNHIEKDLKNREEGLARSCVSSTKSNSVQELSEP